MRTISAGFAGGVGGTSASQLSTGVSADLPARPHTPRGVGWTYDESSMGPGFSYVVIQGGEEGGLGGLMSRPESYPAQAPDCWGVYFWVADLEARTATATTLGATVATEAMTVPGVGTFAVLLDPHHGMFAMIQPEG